jgi:hypothetical protein
MNPVRISHLRTASVDIGGCVAQTIKLSNGEVLVDEDLIPTLSITTWYVSSHGYAHGNIGGKKFLMHRFIMGAKKHDVVDHINGNKLDNRRVNLRFVTKAQNAQNSRKPASKSGFIGVVYEKHGYIKATIKFNGRKRHLGMFKTELEAAKVYDREALKLYGPNARTNIKHLEEILIKLKSGEET